MERRIFWLLSAAVVLLALVLREQYVLQGSVMAAYSGDAGYYVRYAQHLLLGYFGGGDVSDAYRSPGYPALIALTTLVGGDYGLLLQCQAVMGALTVAMTIALGRQWLPAWAALLAGLLVALWPHHIAFTAEVLTEILYGFLLAFAMLVAAVARGRAWAWIGAGVLFAAASMVNPVSALLPVVVGAALIGRAAPSRWFALVAPVVLIVGGWSLRPVDGGSDRVWQNLVQGSHPLYHDAFMQQRGDPAMWRISKGITAETNAIVADPAQGVSRIVRRIAERPGNYAAWYASKAWLLWDWDVRIAVAPGVSVHPSKPSTLEQPPMSVVSALTWTMNPLLFALAGLFALYAAVFARGPARMVALAFLYFTAVHVVLQAEPRYSVPYRQLQMLLVASAIVWISSRVRRAQTTAG